MPHPMTQSTATTHHPDGSPKTIDQQIEEMEQRLEGITEEREILLDQIKTVQDRLTKLQVLARDLATVSTARQKELIMLYKQAKTK